MEYQATSKYIHITTRKMRLIADSIRPLTPIVALEKLRLLNKKTSEPLAKVIASAVANAKQKDAAIETLAFKTIEVMGGPMMKRWRAVSRGTGHEYKKHMTHVRVILIDKEGK